MEQYQVVVTSIAVINLIAALFIMPLLKRLGVVEKEYQEFKLEVAKEYVTKDDMKEHVSTHLASIENKISSLEKLIKQSLRQS